MGSLCLQCLLSWLGHKWDIEIGTDCTTLDCHTELKVNDITQYFTHPDFQSQGPWQHWAIVALGTTTAVVPKKAPCQLLLFYPTHTTDPKGMKSQKSGLFCRLPNGRTAQSKVGDKKWRRLTCAVTGSYPQKLMAGGSTYPSCTCCLHMIYRRSPVFVSPGQESDMFG
jgi:hypothetical protein